MLFEIDRVAAARRGRVDRPRGSRVGDATVRFNGDVGRCVVTSREPETGAIDLPTLAALVRYRPKGRTEPLPFGIYGSWSYPAGCAWATQCLRRPARLERAPVPSL